MPFPDNGQTPDSFASLKLRVTGIPLFVVFPLALEFTLLGAGSIAAVFLAMPIVTIRNEWSAAVGTSQWLHWHDSSPA
jgi:hypothetical protein